MDDEMRNEVEVRIPVDSSTLSHVAYDEGREILWVRFHSGAEYEYYKVPSNVYADLLSAESKGRFYNQYIRDKYNFRMLVDSD